MWFHSLLNSLQSRPVAIGGRRSSRRPTSQLQVEALEDRSVPAAFTDPVGDFLPSYTGPQDPGMDVVAHEVVFLEDQDRLVFYGRMAGPIAPTQAFPGIYLFGVDRGQGTPRFLTAEPVIGPNVVWDAIVRVNADGTGLVNNVLAGVLTPLDPASIRIEGDEFTANVPLSLLLPNSTRPPEEWTYNLWPRNGIVRGTNVHVSDLAPNDGNVPVQTFTPAQVASVVVNDGSMVNSLTVTFDSDGPMTLDPEAFELSRQGGSPVELTVAASVVNGQTVAVLTFAGPEIVGGSLADGNYVLNIRGNHIHDRFGRQLDGDGNGAAGGDRADAFHRLFGDSDGDGQVDGLDRDAFRSAFKSSVGEPDYLWDFDFDGDGDVDGRDNGQFNRRFGHGH